MSSDEDSGSDISDLTRRLVEVERRLAALEDERAILHLLSRYAYYADAGHDDEWVGLFSSDGTMDMATGGDGGYGDGLTFTGHAGLRAFINDPLGHHRPGFYRQSMHAHANNTIITIDGDTAVANTYSILLKDSDAGVIVTGAGVNEWGFQRLDGRWALTLRRRRQMGHPDTAAILSATDERPSQ